MMQARLRQPDRSDTGADVIVDHGTPVRRDFPRPERESKLPLPIGKPVPAALWS